METTHDDELMEVTTESTNDKDARSRGLFAGLKREEYEFLVRESYEGPILGLSVEFQVVRPMKCQFRYLQHPDGSVKLYQGDTCVVCGMFGPADVRMVKELPHRATTDVLFRPKITGVSQQSQLTSNEIPNADERALEATLSSVLESVILLEGDPTFGFNIVIHEYENDGCLLATCFNAANLALVSAGCCIRTMFAAVTIQVCKDKSIIVDPSLFQQKDKEALLTFVFSRREDLLFSSLQGKITKDMMQLCLFTAQEAVKEVFKFFQQIQREDVLEETIVALQPSRKQEEIVEKDDDETEESSSSVELEDDDSNM